MADKKMKTISVLVKKERYGTVELKVPEDDPIFAVSARKNILLRRVKKLAESAVEDGIPITWDDYEDENPTEVTSCFTIIE